MKLLIATGLYAPDIGGSATYTAFLEKHLSRHGVTCIVLPFSRVRRLPRILRHLAYFLWVLVRGVRADVIYGLDTVSVGLPTALAATVLMKPFWLRVPGDYAWEQGQQRFALTVTLDEYLKNQTQAPIRVRLLAFIQRFVARQASRIIVPSDYLKGVVAAWGVDSAKVTRIYNALKFIKVPESREELRDLLGYHGTVIVTAARLVPWKGISMLIDVAADLRESVHPVHLCIIGVGTNREDLMEKVASRKAESYITFLGALPREELGKHLKAADIFALNTSYEGLSHQLIEVMSIGTPIVTTQVGGNPELIEDRKTGLLVPYNDRKALTSALLLLMEEPSLRSELSKRAKAHTTLFHEDVVINEYVALFHEKGS
jgi:glycosyltransferase involved in cell wall biosynthesis